MPTADRKLKVFLSYAQEDFKTVHEIYNRLKSEGWIEPWQDKPEIDLGETWTVAIKRAINSADAVIIFLSENSINKEGFVHYEMRYAWQLSLQKPPGVIFLIPIRLDNCDVPTDFYELDSKQWGDYFDEKKDETYARLLRALRLRLEQKDKERARAEALAKKQAEEKALLETEEERDLKTKKNRERIAAQKSEAERAVREKAEREQKAKEEGEHIALQKAEAERVAREKADVERKVKAERNRIAQQKSEERKKAWVATLRKINFESIVPILFVGTAFFILIGGTYLLRDFSVLKLTKTSTTPTVTITSQVTVTALAEVSPTETQIPPTNIPELATVISTSTLGIGSTITSDGVTMMYVPAGKFSMGSDANSDEKPIHSVYLDAYYIDKYEVNNAAYKRCVDAGICSPPKQSNSATHSSYYGDSEFNDYPVIYVNWKMATAYCEWRGNKLPTEAQWEKAARGTDGRTFPWGVGVYCDKANYCAGDTTKVGSYEKGKSPYEIYDMAGNVQEWVMDWYSDVYYQKSSLSNPLGADTGVYRVIRGGSWNVDFSQVRSTYRYMSDPVTTNNFLGFRCAKSAP